MGLKRFFQNFRSLGRVQLESEHRSSGLMSALQGMIGRVFFFSGDDSLPKVTTESAMRITWFFSCVLVRAETLSIMPAGVRQKMEGGSRDASEHPVHYLIHTRPNPFQTAADFWKSVSAHIDVHGNCFAIVTYSGRYQPKRIDLIDDPWAVQIMKSPSGEAYYNYNGKTYSDYEILHFKDLSLDGIYGCSKIRYNAETLGYAHKLNKYGANAVGVKPPGYFSTDAPYNTVKQQAADLGESWNGAIEKGRPPVLPLGLKYNNIMIAPDEAQYLESRQATKNDVCGIMRVPPTMIQDYGQSTYSTAEQQDLVLVKHTMVPTCTNIEQELNYKLFSEANKESKTPYYVKFNVNGILRGDFESRALAYKTLWERGLITGNQVADLEDWNHYEGGDEHFIPMNMIPLSMVEAFIEKLTEPVKTNVGDQGGDNQRSQSYKFARLHKNGTKVNGHAHHEN